MALKVIFKNLDELKPYENNPRNNDNAVDKVAESIKDYGFKVPIVLEPDGKTIVTGHTRYKAAKKLGLDSVPCIIADDLSPEKLKAFRLADNKVSEFSTWDFDLFEQELSDLQDLRDELENVGFDLSIEEYDTYDFIQIPTEPKPKPVVPVESELSNVQPIPEANPVINPVQNDYEPPKPVTGTSESPKVCPFCGHILGSD